MNTASSMHDEDPREMARRDLVPGRGSLDEFPACAAIAGYRLVRRLGTGGWGVVWEAEQVSLRRRVALKVLRPHLQLSDATVRRFHQEAMTCARLDHPGIVRVFDVGETGGVHYISQELIDDGSTLADTLAQFRKSDRSGPETDRWVAGVVAAVADALQAAHDVGIVHRDVKPSNILMTRRGIPKVGDFGSAFHLDDIRLSESHELLGTPQYMSPEQIAGGHIGIDHRTDIFSLGSTLYELLTLRRPFEGDTPRRVMEAVLLDASPDAKQACPGLPDGLVAICRMALSKRREQRYQSMASLSDDLRRYLAGAPVAARWGGVGGQSVERAGWVHWGRLIVERWHALRAHGRRAAAGA